MLNPACRDFWTAFAAALFAAVLPVAAKENPADDKIVSCQAAPSFRTPGEMAAAYARSAFEIEYLTDDHGGRCKRLYRGGTAFLIDPAGYFLTASHNFRKIAKKITIERAGGNGAPRAIEVEENEFFRGVKHQCPIYLRRGSTRIEVREIFCGNPGDCPLSRFRPRLEQAGVDPSEMCSGDADYSILRAVPSFDADGREIDAAMRFIGVPAPDIYMGQPVAESFAPELAVLGFPAAKDEVSPWVAAHEPDWLAPLTDQYRTDWRRRDEFLSTRGRSTHGLSGSAALDRYGRIWGIDKGAESDKPPFREAFTPGGGGEPVKCDAAFKPAKTGNELFTRAYNLGAGLRTVPLTGEAGLLQDELERGALSETSISFARRGAATHFEAYRLVADILAERAANIEARRSNPGNPPPVSNRYGKGLGEAPLAILNMARCADLSFEMAELAAEMQRLGVFDGQDPWDDSDRVSAVIVASAAYDGVAGEGSAQAREVAGDLLQRALAGVVIGEIDGAHAAAIGGGYARYALLLMRPGRASSAAPDTELTGRLVAAALRLAPNDWRAAFAAAKHFEAADRRRDSRTMGLLALALAEEAETAALMIRDGEGAAFARRARDGIRSETPAIADASQEEIAAASRRIADQYRARHFDVMLDSALPAIGANEPVF